jgi:hypothetical protein
MYCLTRISTVQIFTVPFDKSGKMVIELFKARGWTTIITDDLIGYVLAFTTFSVGILTGLCSVALQMVIDAHLTPDTSDAERAREISPEVAEYWNDSKSFLFGPLPNPQFWAFG